jgi:hypothetical protein
LYYADKTLMILQKIEHRFHEYIYWDKMPCSPLEFNGEYSKEGCEIFLRNDGLLSTDYTTLHLRRQNSSYPTNSDASESLYWQSYVGSQHKYGVKSSCVTKFLYQIFLYFFVNSRDVRHSGGHLGKTVLLFFLPADTRLHPLCLERARSICLVRRFSLNVPSGLCVWGWAGPSPRDSATLIDRGVYSSNPDSMTNDTRQANRPPPSPNLKIRG